MHIDLVKDCIEPLTQPQRGALLETIVAGYYPKIFTESDDEMVRAMAHIIRGNIRNNDERYEKRKQKQAETWAKYNERKKAAQSAQPSQSPQSLQTSQSLQSLQATTTTTSYTSSTTNTSSNTYTDTNTDSGNNTISNKVNNKNNSISENKYTLDKVRELLERERIFFKQNWLKTFYHLNSVTYKWKYDPVSAAYAYISIHPECVKGEKDKENAPQISAAPPKPEVVKISADFAKKLRTDGDEIWAAISDKLKAAVPPDKQNLFYAVQFAEAYRQDYASWALQLVVVTYYDVRDFKQLVMNTEAWKQAMEKYKIKRVSIVRKQDWDKVRG